MSRAGIALFVVACALACHSRQAGAQADVIRGRVTSASIDNRPIDGASVTATSFSGNVNRTALTDRNGRYTITFPGGDGDYYVTVTAIGYSPRRFEVKRTADQDILLGDTRLTPVGAMLDTVHTIAQRNRARPGRNDVPPDVSGTERPVTPSLVPADQVGDLAAMAASLPGVLFIQGVNGDPAGFSVLGLDADQNNTTLNGMNFSGADIPSDANVSVSLSTSPYDVSQGQFSGGRLNIHTLPGSNYITRTSSVIFNTPQLEWTDRTGRALGQQYTNGSLSGVTSGPFVFDKAFYNLSYQLGRRANDLHTLLDTDPVGLEAEGIAADSVARLLGVLRDVRIPSTVGGFPGDRLLDRGLLLSSFDLAPPSSTSGQAFNLTLNGSWNRSSPASLLTTTLPASSFNSTGWNGGAQLHHTNYYGFGILSETGLSFSRSHRYLTPYLDMPGGSVIVRSEFADGTSGVQSIIFGGTSASTSTSTNSLDLTNQLSWFSTNNKHRVKLTSEIRHDESSSDLANNHFGTFAFNSLTDLQAGLPASFTRRLRPITSAGRVLIEGASLGDSYRATHDVQIVYGVRLDANQFTDRPTTNSDVARLFGTPNDHVPNRLYLSPRIGFSWTYGTAQQIGAFEGAARIPRAVVQGGVGIFQNAPSVALMNQAVVNTGLANAVQQLTCAGIATPIPDWDEYGADPATIPTQCTDGTQGTVFASTAPNVTLFARDYATQRSLRSNLQWSGAALDNRVSATINATYSINRHQPEAVDLNFNPLVRFALPAESDRPVFVLPTSIVPATGAIASRDGRVSALFNRVTEMRSNQSSISRQVSIQLSPLTLNSHYTWGVNYALNSVRDHVSGFTSTVGNPFEAAAGRSSLDWRHQILVNLGSNLFDVVRVNWVQRFTSGLPFTPVIAGDVNGDGYANDRAFIYDPARAADTALAASMQALLASSSDNVRHCLQTQLGRLAGRNTCEGPWMSTAFMSISFNPVKVKMPQRATLTFAITNPLGAADLMLHGESRTHGWGQVTTPDTRLLFVRGFDPTSRAYRYEVNQRFGNTSPAASAMRTPVSITASLRIDLGPPRERQNLTQTLDRGRRIPGNKLSESMLKVVYGSAGIVNPMDAILRDASKLRLTGPQADSVATMNRMYVVQLDSIWAPVARYYASLPNGYDQDNAYRRYRKAREASVDLLVKIVPGIKSLLTADQRRKLPSLITAYLDLRYLAAVRSGTSGMPGGVFAPGTGAPGLTTGGRTGG
jgi:carboxypeptidase family protein